MPFDPTSAVAGGLGASFLDTSGSGRSRAARRQTDRAIARYRDYRPSYLLSPEEEAFGERRLGRANELIGVGARQARTRAARRLGARGITGAPLEQSFSDIEQGAENARVGASRDVADILERIRQSGLAFDRGRARDIFGAELGLSQRDFGQAQAGQADFWNSIMSTLPLLLAAA